MAKYRKVSPCIWNDGKFRRFSRDGQLVFLFLLTHPHMTALGAMRANVAGLASELGWLPKAFREAFQEPFSMGMVRYDEEASFMWLPNFLAHNRPESPNVVKSWEKALELLPECPMFFEMIQEVNVFIKGLPEGFRQALPEAFGKTMPNQEQEQEQEQEKKKTPPSPPKGGGGYAPAFEVFWAECPDKVKKKRAWAAWKKIKGVDAATIIDAFKAQLAARHFRGADGKDYIPHPATWLNDRRWEDVIKQPGGSDWGEAPPPKG